MSHKLYYNPPPPRPNIVRISQVGPLPPVFAVDGILPICSLTAILATPGAGKTTLACMLAAATHPPYDLTCDHPTVLMVSPFTDAQLEVRPRLVQLGTNLNRVRVMDHLYIPDARSNPRRAYNIHDLSIIDSELSQYRSYRLLIIDCAEMFLDLPSRPNRRKVLEQLYKLIDLANAREISVVLMLTASQLRENPFASTMLSAVAEASRTSYILDRDSAGQRTLYAYKNVLGFMAKNHLISDLPSQATYASASDLRPEIPDPSAESESRDCGSEIEPSAQSQIEIRKSKICTLESPPLPEDQIALRNRSLFLPHPDQLPFASRRLKERQKPGPEPYARDFACEVLLDSLQKGPRPVGDKDDPQPRTLMYDLKLANITFGTAMRAKRHLNIEAYKKGRKWFWRLLPIPNAQIEQARTTTPTTCTPSPESPDNAGRPPRGYSREQAIAPEPLQPLTAPSGTDLKSQTSDSSSQSPIENSQSGIPQIPNATPSASCASSTTETTQLSANADGPAATATTPDLATSGEPRPKIANQNSKMPSLP